VIPFPVLSVLGFVFGPGIVLFLRISEAVSPPSFGLKSHIIVLVFFTFHDRDPLQSLLKVVFSKTSSRLYLETMERVMERMNKIFVQDAKEHKPIDLNVIDLERKE
jgi:hypothetical protein